MSLKELNIKAVEVEILEGIPNQFPNVFLDSYEAYVNAGYTVMPIQSISKKAFLPDWQTFGDAPQKSEVYSLWANQFKDGNLGLCLGKYNKIVVFDFDYEPEATDKKGQLILQELMNVWLSERYSPKNLVKFGNKGFSILYRANEEIYVKLKKFKKNVKHVYDILFERQQTVLPPSIHPNGFQEYKWLSERTLLNIKIEEIPFFPIEKLKATLEIVEKHPELNTQTKRNSGTTIIDNDFVHGSGEVTFIPKNHKVWPENALEFCRLNNIRTISQNDRYIYFRCIEPSRHKNADFHPSAAIYKSGYYTCYCGRVYSIYGIESAFDNDLFKPLGLANNDNNMNYRRFELADLSNGSLKLPNNTDLEGLKELIPLFKQTSPTGLIYEIIGAGCSIELVGSNFFKKGQLAFPKTQINKFLQLWQSSKLPMITNIKSFQATDESSGLIGYHKEPPTFIHGLYNNNIPNHIICVPCGFGKTTTLRNYYCADINYVKNSPSHLFLTDRLDGVLAFKQALDYYQSNAKIRDSFGEKAGKRQFPHASEARKVSATWHDIFGDNTELHNAKEVNAAGNLHQNIRASFSYKAALCLKENPPEKAPVGFCVDCPFSYCGANKDSRNQRSNSKFLVASTASFWLRSENLMKYKKGQREVIVIDEKPKLFETLSLNLNNSNDELTLKLSILNKIGDEHKETKLKEIKEKILRNVNIHVANLKRFLEKDPEKKKNVYFSYKALGILSSDDYDTIAKEFHKYSKTQDSEFRNHNMNTISQLKLLTEPFAIHRFDNINADLSITVALGYNYWNKYKFEGVRTIIFDATAFVDPEYSLPGAFSVTQPEQVTSFPNLTFFCYSYREISKKKAIRELEDIVNYINRIESENPGAQTLIISSDDIDKKLSKRNYKENIKFNHFGNLRGSNEYRDFNIVCFLNLQRYNELDYISRLMHFFSQRDTLTSTWIQGSNVKNSLFNTHGTYGVEFRNPHFESLRVQFMVAGLIQDIMRINLRSNNNAHAKVYIPTSDPAIIGRLLQYFKGAKVQKMEGV